jgi:hypothetical protein
MSDRDEFAKAALTALIGMSTHAAYADVAYSAYQYADAALEEQSKRNPVVSAEDCVWVIESDGAPIWGESMQCTRQKAETLASLYRYPEAKAVRYVRAPEEKP